MSTYKLSNGQHRYKNAANPPVLDKVVFTIDHIHSGNHEVASTYEVVKFLVDLNIPVTVFFQATSPSHDYEFDRQNAQLIYGLSPHLVTLGIHPLPAGHSQSRQLSTFNIISKIVQQVTGKKTQVLSYHGAGAGPMPGITFPGIKYARGIGSQWSAGGDDPLNTPVAVMNSVKRSFDYTSERNSAGLSSTIFVHTQELTKGSRKKEIFDAYIKEVKAQRLQAISYLEAMQADFKEEPAQPGSDTHNNNNHSGNNSGSNSSGDHSNDTPSDNTGGHSHEHPVTPKDQGSLRLSASEKSTRRPIKADFKIRTPTGTVIESASKTTSHLFRIPVGKYQVSAQSLGHTETKQLELTKAQGIHHIFMMPVDKDNHTHNPNGGSSANNGAMGSLRLSASDKSTRRPVKADFLVQDLKGKLIDSAASASSHLFRLPAASYQVSAILGGISASNEITLTSTQGIHHIFLIPNDPSNRSGGSSPIRPAVPSANPIAMGSLRLSASEKNSRRPMKADFLIQDMNGKLIDTAANVETFRFKIPAGQYRIKAHANGKTVGDTIHLNSSQGIHHIFLIPS